MPGDWSEPNSLLQGESSIRRTSRALAPVLVLALAVFAWRLQYKLSLYHPDVRRTGVPAATLLSPKERSASIAKLEAPTLAGSQLRASNRHIAPATAGVPGNPYLDAKIRIERFLRSQQGPSGPRFPQFSLSNPRAPPIHA